MTLVLSRVTALAEQVNKGEATTDELQVAVATCMTTTITELQEALSVYGFNVSASITVTRKDYDNGN